MSIANELSSEIAVALMTAKSSTDNQTPPDTQQVSQLVLQLHSTLNDLKAKTKLARRVRTKPRIAAAS